MGFREDIDKEREEFSNFLRKESERISTLPNAEREDAFIKLKFLKDKGYQNIGTKYRMEAQGVKPEEEQSLAGKVLSPLQWVLKQLDRPTTAKNALLLSQVGPEGEQEEFKKKAIEAGTGGDVAPVTGKEVIEKSRFLEKFGINPKAKLSDTIPGIFSETGEEWLKLKKEGIADITAAGAGGLAFDIGTDPLLLLGPALKFAGISSKLGKATEVAAAPIKRALYNNKITNPMVRAFNNFSLLSRDPKVAARSKESLLEFATDWRNVSPKLAKEMMEDPGLKSIRNVLDNPEVLQKTIETARDIEDLTSAIMRGDWNTIKRLDPELQNVLRTVMKDTGKLNFRKAANIIMKQRGLDWEQKKTIWFFRNAFNKQTKRKVEAGIISAKTAEQNPFYMPRRVVDFTPVQSMDEIQKLQTLYPEQADVLEKMLISRENALLRGEAETNLNSLLRGRAPGLSLSDKDRTFKTWRDSSNFAKLFQGSLEDDMLELLYQSEKGLRMKEIQVGLAKKLDNITGGFGPSKEMQDTIQRIIKENTPEAWGALKRTWNKYVLNPLKMSLTLPFPAFHVRNTIDNTFRGYQKLGLKFLDPVTTREAMHVGAGSNGLVKFGNGIEFTGQQIEEAAYNMGVKRYGFSRSDVRRPVDNVRRQWANAEPSVKGMLRRTASNIGNAGEIIGTKFENQARIKAMLTGAKQYIKKKGWANIDDMADPKMQEALSYGAKKSKEAFFDYLEMGPVDDALAQLIPFYRFSRQNIPFQVKAAIQNPERLGVVAKVQNSFNAENLTEEESSLLAPYLRENVMLSLGENDTGEHLILSGTGLSLEEFNKLWSTEGDTRGEQLARTLEKLTIGQAAAPLQGLYTYITNRQPFFGTELSDWRAKNTNKALYKLPLFKQLVGGIEKEAVRIKDKKVEYRYELQDPKRYAMVMSVLLPALSATAFKALPGVPGIGQALAAPAAGALSPRGITSFKALGDERTNADIKVLKFLTGLKLSERDFNRDKYTKMLDEVNSVYKDLRTKSWQMKKMQRLSRQASEAGIDEDLLPGLNLGDEEE